MTENQYRDWKAGLLLVSCLGCAFAGGMLTGHTTRLLDELRADSLRLSKSGEVASETVQRAITPLFAMAQGEQAHLDAELKETRKATADIHDLIIHTDLALNGQHAGSPAKWGDGILGDIHARIIPSMVDVLDSTGTATRRVALNLDRVSSTTDAVVAKVGPLVEAMTARVSDPAYDAILANAQQSMQNLTAATGSAAHSLATADAVVTKEANIILAPASKAKTAALFILQALGRFLGY